MKQLYFYLLLGVFLYFVINKFIDNYLRQENFDPSLVPVSSIVTLAKVAQKLVDGNGTLTNPGNLQIGASTATPGNLTVTGNSTVIGNLTASNSTVTGDSTVTGNSIVTGDLTSSNLKVTDDLDVDNNLNVNKNSLLNGNLDVNSNIAAKGSVVFGGKTSTGFKWTNESDNGWACLRAGNNEPNTAGNRLCYHKDHGLVHFHSDGKLELSGGKLQVNGSFNTNDNNMNVDNSLKVGGSLTVGGPINYTNMGNTGLPVGTFKIRNEGRRVPLYYGWNMMWPDNNWANDIRTRVKWNGSDDDRFMHYAGIDMRNGSDGDVNCTARAYSLMPGYKLQFYTNWNPVGPEYTGEQVFDDKAFEGKRVHCIAVRYTSDNWSLPPTLISR